MPTSVCLTPFSAYMLTLWLTGEFSGQRVGAVMGCDQPITGHLVSMWLCVLMIVSGRSSREAMIVAVTHRENLISHLPVGSEVFGS